MEDLLQAGVGADTLAVDDIDLDTDMQELAHAASPTALGELALWTLGLRAPLPPGHPALNALAPELSPERAWVFLLVVAVNLAFRLRSDELLRALAAHAGQGLAPRLDPTRLGELLVRARSARQATALLAAAPLADDARAAAQAAAVAPPPPPPGSRLHVEAAGHETVLQALCLALNGEPHPPVGAPPDARGFMLLRRRGGFVTVLGQGDRIEPELARELAGKQGISRVIRAELPQPVDLLHPEPSGALELLVLAGRRVVLDTAGLAARLGEAPTPDDLTGELLALGVLDLDPGHARGGRAELGWTEATRGRPRGSRGIAIG